MDIYNPTLTTAVNGRSKKLGQAVLTWVGQTIVHNRGSIVHMIIGLYVLNDKELAS